MLRRHGYEVIEVPNGKDALRVLEESAALPRVVLLDMATPVMGGDELSPILENNYPTLKNIVSSATPRRTSEEDLRLLRFPGFCRSHTQPSPSMRKSERSSPSNLAQTS